MLPNGWKKFKLGNIFDFKNGYNTEKDNYGSGVKFANVMDIFSNEVLSSKKIKGSVNISDKLYQEYELRYGDILLNRTSETVEDIAISSVYLDDDKSIFGGFVIRARPKSKEVCSEYIRYAFNLNTTRKEFVRRCQGAVRANIGQKDLIKIAITLPPLEEQKAIAAVLTKWDEAIDKVSNLIDEKKLRKKSLMQKLLTGKLRFPEFEGIEWKKSKLCEYIKIQQREIPKPDENYLSLGIRSHCKGLFHKPDTDPSKNAMDNLYIVNKNDLVVNITFAWEGAIAIADKVDEGGLVSHRFPTYVFDPEVAYHGFFKYLVQSKLFRYYLGLISPGGAGRNRVMSKKDFLKIKISCPTLPEQKKIAETLSLADKEINLLQSKLDALNLQKKGLMQQLLTGKKRVNLQNKEAA